MKNYIKQYLLLLITIAVFAGLLLLKFSPGIDWGDTVLTRSLNFLFITTAYLFRICNRNNNFGTDIHANL